MLYKLFIILGLTLFVLMAYLDYEYGGGKKMEQRRIARKKRKKREKEKKRNEKQ